MTQRPIAEHGVVGDLRTTALFGTDGTVDWFCAPRFGSPSLFAALLDAERGGHWILHPTCEVASRQQFSFPDSNVLITRFLTEHGIVEVQDFMPLLRPHDPDHRCSGTTSRSRRTGSTAPRAPSWATSPRPPPTCR